jgi:hypothetical protein
MKAHGVMAFHILAEIQNRIITNPETLLKWYSRSLAYFQGEEFSIEDAQGLMDDLEKMEMVINKGTYYALTGLGKVSGWLYYSPYDVYGGYRNFHFLLRGTYLGDKTYALDIQQPQLPLMDDYSLSWALTDIPSNDWGYIPKDVAHEVEEMRWKLRNRGIMASDAIHFSLAAYKTLTGVEMEGPMRAASRAIKYDIYRVSQALGLIDSMYGKWDKANLWKILPTRINYGIPEDMVELVSLPGIGGVKARKMWDRGIKGLGDVLAKTDVLKTLFLPITIQKLQKDARRILLMSEGKKNG